MTAIRRASVAAVIFAVAVSAGCGGSRGNHATPAPVTPPAATTSATGAADSGAAVQPKPAAARTTLLAVLDDYERDGAAVKTGKPKKSHGDDMTKYYADAAAMTAIHGGGGIGAPLGCGKASAKSVIDGAIIDVPDVSGDGVELPVTLFAGATPVTGLLVGTDQAGRLTGITCRPPAVPDLPGAQVLAAFYGGVAALAADPNADDKTGALKDRYLAPAFAKFTRPDVDADQSLCAEDALTYWHAVYDPTATTTGAQWYFNAGGGGQVNMSVAVDSAAGHVAWVYCFGQLAAPPAPGAAYSDTQIQSFIGDLFNDYAYLHALTPFGADASGMKAYFASDAAYQSAVTGTGAQPLECSATAATSIGADSVTLSGQTAVIGLTSSPSGHPVTTGALGHPTVTVDPSTMKITKVACA